MGKNIINSRNLLSAEHQIHASAGCWMPLDIMKWIHWKLFHYNEKKENKNEQFKNSSFLFPRRHAIGSNASTFIMTDRPTDHSYVSSRNDHAMKCFSYKFKSNKNTMQWQRHSIYWVLGTRFTTKEPEWKRITISDNKKKKYITEKRRKKIWIAKTDNYTMYHIFIYCVHCSLFTLIISEISTSSFLSICCSSLLLMLFCFEKSSMLFVQAEFP